MNRQIEVLPGAHLVASAGGVVVVVAHRSVTPVTPASIAGRTMTALLGIVRRVAADEPRRSGRTVARLATNWLMSLENGDEDDVEFGVLTPTDTGLAVFLHGGVSAILDAGPRTEILRGREAGFTVDRVVLPAPSVGAGLFVDEVGLDIETLPTRGVFTLTEGTTPGAGAVLWFGANEAALGGIPPAEGAAGSAAARHTARPPVPANAPAATTQPPPAPPGITQPPTDVRPDTAPPVAGSSVTNLRKHPEPAPAQPGSRRTPVGAQEVSQSPEGDERDRPGKGARHVVASEEDDHGHAGREPHDESGTAAARDPGVAGLPTAAAVVHGSATSDMQGRAGSKPYSAAATDPGRDASPGAGIRGTAVGGDPAGAAGESDPGRGSAAGFSAAPRSSASGASSSGLVPRSVGSAHEAVGADDRPTEYMPPAGTDRAASAESGTPADMGGGEAGDDERPTTFMPPAGSDSDAPGGVRAERSTDRGGVAAGRGDAPTEYVAAADGGLSAFAGSVVPRGDQRPTKDMPPSAGDAPTEFVDSGAVESALGRAIRSERAARGSETGGGNAPSGYVAAERGSAEGGDAPTEYVALADSGAVGTRGTDGGRGGGSGAAGKREVGAGGDADSAASSVPGDAVQDSGVADERPTSYTPPAGVTPPRLVKPSNVGAPLSNTGPQERVVHDQGSGPVHYGGSVSEIDMQETVVPTSARTPHVPEVASSDPGVVIKGFKCARDHLNDPRVSFCAVCGIRMDQLTCVLTDGVRPPLGLLLLDDGTSFVLDADCVLGREPEHAEAVSRGARPVRLEDRSGGMSRAHAEIRLVDWDVTVVDGGSTNGTHIRQPGHQDWSRAIPGHPVKLIPGAQVQLGSRVVTFDSQHGQL
ncbi:FHA domain-containing protein [Nocardia vulneris]|uniref:FHA domain-containing protein n=1 Tax=Nocardia vulneris TaxID=1141657 RepID=UPI0030CEA2F0